jgi:signal peptidase II
MGPWEILLLVGAIVLADRVTKEIAVRRLAPDRGGSGGVLRLVTNERPLLARRTSRGALVALWMAAVGCAAASLAFSPALRANSGVTVAVAVVLAGASSNLRDRLTRGAIVDFIAIGWWPVFNLADVAIVAGAVVAAVSLV